MGGCIYVIYNVIIIVYVLKTKNLLFHYYFSSKNEEISTDEFIGVIKYQLY